MKTKDLTISVLKGLGIILVVYGHLIQRSMIVAGQDFFLNPIFKVLYTFHMPLFFFISGYLMAISLNHRTIGESLKRKYRSLFVPFLSWGLLGVMVVYALRLPGELANADNLSIWFVWFLLTLFVSSGLLIGSVELKKYIGIAAFPLVYTLLLMVPANDYLGIYYIKWFYLFYLAGYLMKHYDLKISNPFINAGIFLGSLVIFVVFVSYWDKIDYIYQNKMTLSPRTIYRYMTGFLGIIVVWRVGEFLAKTRMQVVLAYAGMYSLDIYLIQRYIVEGLYPKFLSQVHGGVDLSGPFFIYFITPLLAFFFTGLCVLISKLLIKRSVLLNKFLLGDR